MKSKFVSKLSSKTIGLSVFILVFVSLTFFYSLHETMFFRPQSTHAWRQTDCLSITQNYYQLNNSFCEPEIHNQLSDDDFTGKTAGEFPLLYYSVAQLWKLIGKSEFAYRLVVLLISFTGLIFIFKFSQEILKNNLQALFVSLGIFTSAAYVYYSANFLTNIPALSLIFIGWYFIWKFYKNDFDKYLWISMLFLSLGILFKVSAGISFVALMGWVFIELFRKKENRTLFKRPLKQLLPFIVSITIVIVWYAYANYYNNIHDGKYTFNNVWPIWAIPEAKVWEILEKANVLTLPVFFHSSMLYVTGIMWIFLLTTFKKRSLFLNYLVIIIPFGSLMYGLLWFQAFDHHDYYYIDFYVNFIIIWILFFKTTNGYPRINNLIVNLAFIGFLFYNAYQSKLILDSRYIGWKNASYIDHMKALGELEPVFEDFGIGPYDKVISIPDKSINISLYMMNHRGFTNYNSKFDKPGTYQRRIQDGAKYLVINDTLILNDSLIQPFISYPVTTYKNVKIFNLKPYFKQ